MSSISKAINPHQISAIDDVQLTPWTLKGAQDSIPRGVFVLAFLLGALQIADGVLTSMGVSKYGIAAEGNLFLRSLMEQFGYLPTLAFVKGLSILIIFVLVLAARQVSWVCEAMGAVCCIYIFAAIIPWSYILFFSPALSS